MNIKLCGLLWVSLTLIIHVLPSSAAVVKSSLQCHGSMVLLKCEPADVIDVIWANYGRTHSTICSDNNRVPVTNCYAENSTEIVQNRCNHKNTCAMEASHLIFGDPCVGIFKYLDIRYQCIKPNEDQHSVLICEGDMDEIKCEDGKQIRITNANYGRTNRNICQNKNNQNTKCSSSQALGVLKKKCDMRERCTIESNSDVFGNPCEGTSKYLTLTFTCTSPSVRKEKTALDCHGSTLQLDCEEDETISIIWANYGRTESIICKNPASRDTECYARNSTEIVQERCNHKGRCSMEASHLIFGDPCVGTFKYLSIKYACNKPEDLCANQNEEYSKCFKCDPTCDHPLYRICFMNAHPSGCICKKGYVRDDFGDCIKLEDCPKYN